MAAFMIRLARKSGPLSEDGGDDALMEHKAIAKALPALDAVAAEMAVRPLSAFLSEDPDNVMDLVDDEDEAEAILAKLPPVKWSSPAVAVLTVVALLARLTDGPPVAGVKVPAKLVADLRDVQTVLNHAITKRATFRFYREF